MLSTLIRKHIDSVKALVPPGRFPLLEWKSPNPGVRESPSCSQTAGPPVAVPRNARHGMNPIRVEDCGEEKEGRTGQKLEAMVPQSIASPATDFQQTPRFSPGVRGQGVGPLLKSGSVSAAYKPCPGDISKPLEEYRGASGPVNANHQIK